MILSIWGLIFHLVVKEKQKMKLFDQIHFKFKISSKRVSCWATGFFIGHCYKNWILLFFYSLCSDCWNTPSSCDAEKLLQSKDELIQSKDKLVQSRDEALKKVKIIISFYYLKYIAISLSIQWFTLDLGITGI